MDLADYLNRDALIYIALYLTFEDVMRLKATNRFLRDLIGEIDWVGIFSQNKRQLIVYLKDVREEKHSPAASLFIYDAYIMVKTLDAENHSLATRELYYKDIEKIIRKILSGQKSKMETTEIAWNESRRKITTCTASMIRSMRLKTAEPEFKAAVESFYSGDFDLTK